VWIGVGLPSVSTDVYDTDVDEELSTNGTQQVMMTLQKRTTP
jgi:hypothetical protein